MEGLSERARAHGQCTTDLRFCSTTRHRSSCPHRDHRTHGHDPRLRCGFSGFQHRRPEFHSDRRLVSCRGAECFGDLYRQRRQWVCDLYRLLLFFGINRNFISPSGKSKLPANQTVSRFLELRLGKGRGAEPRHGVGVRIGMASTPVHTAAELRVLVGGLIPGTLPT